MGNDEPARTALLVGVDGSTSSLRAAAYAVGLARRQRCRLVVAYVRTPPPALLPLADGGGVAVTVNDVQDEVEQELRAAFAQEVPALGVDAHFVTRSGDPYGQLLELAKLVSADAVIVGRSTQPIHRIAGSLGAKLVRCGRWPVTVVP
ncbi:universal stress protein [Paractinoplanes lichenicola]|uniref:Universal stress protein n=1 Tax=Paractinoplanes lichenicola TaxID=2802976 RepID=A0ABS1VML2_9ACTN|nr:universal stress protein [Actinoplanes lichenicola]MBL7255977.1 universal stress protein [Actinoplanes lichenicola]